MSRRRPSRRWPRLAAACLGTVGSLLLYPAAGLAGSIDTDRLHTQLEESRPADEAVLTESPSEIWLRFSTAVQASLSTIEFTRADGTGVALGDVATVVASEDMQLHARLMSPRLESGVYTVVWTTAGPDSHIIEGSFTFRVELPSIQEAETDTAASVEAAAASGQVDEPTTGETNESEGAGQLAEATAPLGLSARWFSFLGSVLLIGIAAFNIAVVGGARKRGEAEAVAEFLPRLRGYGYLVVSLAFVGVVLKVIDGAVTFGPERLGALVFASPWGLSWWLYLLGAIAAFVGIRVTGRTGTNRSGWRLLTLGGLLTAISMPFAGHGWAAASRVITAPNHVLHTVSAGIWMGSLAVLVLVALPFLSKRKDADGRSAEAPAWVASFSRIALIGVGALLVTGAVNTWQHVGSFTALFTSPYGRTLLAKIGVLSGAMMIGLYNWKQARPALDETGRPGLIKLPATVELALGIGVLLVSAVLVAMHLPA